MSQIDKLYIAATGMITPVGFNTQMTAAAVNAGVSRVDDLSLLDKYLKPIKMSSIPSEVLLENSNDELSPRRSRMLSMAGIALSEAFTNFKLNEYEKLPLFIALPECLPKCVPAVNNNFVELLIENTGLAIDKETSRQFFTGKAGGLQALDMAFKYLQSTEARACVIGGVDSYFDPYLLGQLDAQKRLNSQHTDNGFIPAEAAAFLILTKDPIPSNNNRIETALYSPAFSNETGHIYSDKPYLGNALSHASMNALTAAPNLNISSLVSSLNGESFGGKELGNTLSRQSKRLTGVEIEHPIDCLGDIGAAFAPIVIAISAAIGKQENKLICCSSDLQYRSAVCLQTRLLGGENAVR